MKVYFVDSLGLDKVTQSDTRAQLFKKLRLPVPKSGLYIELQRNQTHADIFFIKGDSTFPLSIRCAVFFKKPDVFERLINSSLITSKNAGSFVTVVSDEFDYFKIFDHSEIFDIFKVLKGIREYSYLYNTELDGSSIAWLHDNTNFNELFERKQLRYLIEHGYRRFRDEVYHRKSGSGVDCLSITMRPQSIQNEVYLEFDFTSQSLVESGIFAIIGKNGAGKSQSLLALQREAVSGSKFKKVIDINLSRKQKSTLTEDHVSLSNFQERNSIITMSLSKLLTRQLRTRKSYYFDSLFILHELLGRDIGCDDMLIPMLDSRPTYVSFRNLERNVYERVNLKKEVIFIKNGQEFYLSQGQNFILRFVLMILLHIEQYSLLLIDEPEVYLHPNLIVSLHRIIQRIMKETRSKAVVATHSIFFIREMPKEYVKILSVNGDRISCRTPAKETFGGSLDALAEEIFYDEEANSVVDDYIVNFKEGKGKISFEDLREIPSTIASRILAYDKG